MTKPNYQSLELILNRERPALITTEHFLDREFWEWVANFRPDPNELLKLIVKSDSKNPLAFSGEIFCESCRQWRNQTLNKSAILLIIRSLVPTKTGNTRKGYLSVLCGKCQEIAKKREEEERERRWREMENRSDEARGITPQDRIDWHNYMLTSEVPADFQWGQARQTLQSYSEICGDGEIEKRIRIMPYREFLQTFYWKLVAWLAKRDAGGRCMICNRNDALSAHHRTYENHGREHTWLGRKDIIAICQPCHDRHHINRDYPASCALPAGPNETSYQQV